MIIEISEKELKECLTWCLDLDWTGVVVGTKQKWKARIPDNLQKKIVKGIIGYLKFYKKK